MRSFRSLAIALSVIVLASALVLPYATPAERAATDLPSATTVAAGPGTQPVIGRPIVIGRAPRAPARIRDTGVLDVAITPDPALVDGGDGRATIALARATWWCAVPGFVSRCRAQLGSPV